MFLLPIIKHFPISI